MEKEIENNKSKLFYACCPFCNNTLAQAKNGMDGYIKCPKCDKYIHIIIRNGTVVTKTKT